MDNNKIKKFTELCVGIAYNWHKLIYIYSSVFYQLITGEY